MSRVVVVGSVNLDLVVAVPRLPEPGATVLGSDVTYQPGGKGGNQAVAARRLGADTVLVAALGDDAFGNDLRETLQREGLPGEAITTVQGAATGIAMIPVSGNGENSIVVASGANALLDASRLDVARLEPGAVLALQLEVPLATCLDAAARARRAGALVQVNAAPLPKTDDPAFADLLRSTDVLVVNEGEARSLAGDAAADWPEMAVRLRESGPAAVVITLGADGAVAADADGTHSQPAFAVEAVDTTGAGDAFCGALAVALADGLPLADAVRRGCAAGAIAATTPGAQSALPTAAELETFLTGTGD